MKLKKKQKQPTKQKEKNHCKKRLRFMQSNNNNNDKIFIVGSDWVFHNNVKKFLILWIESMMDGETAGRARVVTMIGELIIKNVRKYARPNLYPNGQLWVWNYNFTTN